MTTAPAADQESGGASRKEVEDAVYLLRSIGLLEGDIGAEVMEGLFKRVMKAELGSEVLVARAKRQQLKDIRLLLDSCAERLQDVADGEDHTTDERVAASAACRALRKLDELIMDMGKITK